MNEYVPSAAVVVGLADRQAEVVRPGQPDRHAGDPGLAGAAWVPSLLASLYTTPARLAPFTSPKLNPVLAAAVGQVDAGEPVVGHGRGRRRPVLLLAVDVPGRLGLGDRVRARASGR